MTVVRQPETPSAWLDTVAAQARAFDRSSTAERVADVLRRNGGHPGHVFNLGHGVLPETDPGILGHVADLVHAHRSGD